MEFPLSSLKILTYDAVKVLHSICQQIWKTQQWSQDRIRLVFIEFPRKSIPKKCTNYCTVVLISHANKVITNFFKLGFRSM